MALLFMDSFDHYATADLTEKWSATSTGASDTSVCGAFGRRSTNGWRMSSTGGITRRLYKSLAPADNTIIVGMAVHPVTPFGSLTNQTDPNNDTAFPASQAACLMMVRHLNVDQCWVRVNQTGTMTVFRGATPVQTTSASLAAATSTYVEILLTIDNTAGVIKIRFNGADVASFTSQNIRATTDAWDQLRLGGFGGGFSAFEWRFDDLYVLDGSGPAPWNTFLGDVRVDYHTPNAVGSNNMSTPGTGTDRYALVDELIPNDDTGLDYVTLAAGGDKDTYNMEPLKATGLAILGMQVIIATKKADTGVATMCPVFRQAGVDYDNVTPGFGPTIVPTVLSGSYLYRQQIYQTNPATGLQFSEAEFNALELGVKRVI